MKQQTLSNLVKAAAAAASLAIIPAISAAGADDKASRDLPTFSKIHVKGAIELDVSVGGSQSVEIASKNIEQDRIITKVRNDTLYIDVDGDGRDFWKDVEIDVTISMEDFTGIEIKGAVDGVVEGVKSDEIEIEIGGAADLTLSGSCGKLELDVKGAGDINARKLECEEVVADVKGAGDASVYANKKVKAEIKGVGNIDIYGDPDVVDQSVKGLGEINTHK